MFIPASRLRHRIPLRRPSTTSPECCPLPVNARDHDAAERDAGLRRLGKPRRFVRRKFNEKPDHAGSLVLGCDEPDPSHLDQAGDRRDRAGDQATVTRFQPGAVVADKPRETATLPRRP